MWCSKKILCPKVLPRVRAVQHFFFFFLGNSAKEAVNQMKLRAKHWPSKIQTENITAEQYFYIFIP